MRMDASLYRDYDINLIYANFFLHFFEIILSFKNTLETLCTNFVNYFVEILMINLLQDDFRKTIVNAKRAILKHTF